MNHDGHDRHDDFRMRLPSPLTADEERTVTAVIDCAMHVHRALGPGFLESIYRRAMCIALAKRSVSFEVEKAVAVYYEGTAIHGHRVDLVVERHVVVELKSAARLDEIHHVQLISYLKATGLRAGLLINFRVPLLHRGLRRIVL